MHGLHGARVEHGIIGVHHLNALARPGPVQAEPKPDLVDPSHPLGVAPGGIHPPFDLLEIFGEIGIAGVDQRSPCSRGCLGSTPLQEALGDHHGTGRLLEGPERRLAELGWG